MNLGNHKVASFPDPLTGSVKTHRYRCLDVVKVNSWETCADYWGLTGFRVAG